MWFMNDLHELYMKKKRKKKKNIIRKLIVIVCRTCVDNVINSYRPVIIIVTLGL